MAESSGSNLTNLLVPQVQAVSQLLELHDRVLDDLFRAGQPSPRCKGWPSVDQVLSLGSRVFGVELWALPLGFMARYISLSLFWMLQGSKQPLGPPPSQQPRAQTPAAQGLSVEEVLQVGSATGLTLTGLENLQG